MHTTLCCRPQARFSRKMSGLVLLCTALILVIASPSSATMAESAPSNLLRLRREGSGQCATMGATLHGAHVCSWVAGGLGEEVLFMSPLAKFGPKDAIRGGIPLCFPQFGPRGPLQQHGFFRKSNEWSASEPETLSDSGDVRMVFTHSDTEETRASAWPHKFDAKYEVTLGKDTLTTRLHVVNKGAAAFEFTCALHTYIRVADVSQARVEGLKAVEYEEAGATTVDTAEAVTFAGEVDRVYGPVGGDLCVVDDAGAKRVVIAKDSGFPDVVVWNPWIEKAAALADLPDDAYKQFVCVEVGAIRKPIRLQGGEEWAGTQTIRATKL